jgi:hypothetical protein
MSVRAFPINRERVHPIANRSSVLILKFVRLVEEAVSRSLGVIPSGARDL